MEIHTIHVPSTYRHVNSSELNAWLEMFQLILNRMTSDNFRWFLHVMLFIHTQSYSEAEGQRESGGKWG